MNEDKLIDLNSIHFSTPHLMSIPPQEAEIRALKNHQKRLKEEGKREIIICCKNTRDFLQGAVNLGITDRELQILIQTLHLHPYDRFGGNKFEKRKGENLDLEGLINEILEISSFFSEGLQKYFKEEFYNLVQKENTNPAWSLTLEKFSKKWKELVINSKPEQNINLFLNQEVLRILEEIDRNGLIPIHKDTPQQTASYLRRMEAYGLVWKKNYHYVMSEKGYDVLENHQRGNALADQRQELTFTDQDKKGLKEMVGRNEISEVIEIIKSRIGDSTNTFDQIIVIQSRLTNLNDRKIKGTIDLSSEILEENKISSAIVEMIKNL